MSEDTHQRPNGASDEQLDGHDQYVYAGIIVSSLLLFVMPAPIQLVGSAWLVGLWFKTAWAARSRGGVVKSD